MLEEFVVETPLTEKGFGLANRSLRDPSDVELVSALIDNRPEAQRLVVQRFAPLVRGLLRRSLGPKCDIDDAQQEVFWCLFRRIDTLREPAALRAFIMAITFRVALHERRRSRKFSAAPFDHERAEPTTKHDDAVASYALIRLGKLVLRLHERERKTFVLRFIEGMTVSEIAGALAISEATTRRSFSRAWSSVNKWAARDPFLFDYFGSGQPLPPVD